jgi:zinc/manganese transport system substrate-binding protein
MRFFKSIALASMILLFIPALGRSVVHIVTTTEDLAALAREVGGEDVEVQSIAKGYQDPHFVDAKPSYLLKLQKADLFIQVGLELEVAWAPPLLTAARNSRILPGGPGFLDASIGCDILEKPAATPDRSQGDVHPFGNPHYWLDPRNGRTVARNIARRLAELDLSHGTAYRTRLTRFEEAFAAKEKEWDALAAPLKGLRVVTYHNSWPNFARRFGFTVVGFVEPKPGVPPAPAHLQALMEQIKSEKIPLILVEPYFDLKLPEKIARQTGTALVTPAPSVGGGEGVKSYFDLFDKDLALITSAVAGKGGR